MTAVGCPRLRLQLEWIGANVNFLGGLLLVSAMIGVKAYLLLSGSCFSLAAALIVASILASAISLVNEAIREGGTDSSVHFGDSFWSLLVRYARLKLGRLLEAGPGEARGLFALLSIACAVLGVGFLGLGIVREAVLVG